ncbi:MAG: peptidyl-prolyl cis-trans isomerase C [Halioglobus sp.]|jgi:peptidyl-prolyl cis-trans isomerase C
MKLSISRTLALLVFLSPFTVWSQVVIEDEGVTISQQELEQLVLRWTPQMRKAAAIDVGDRLELINIALIAKKIALEGDKLSSVKDGDVYWDYVLKIRRAKQNIIMKNFLDNLVIPDMTELSKERFENDKDRIAKVPEVRSSSHILFECGIDACDRAVLRPKVSKVFSELQGGADFTAMVHKYSQDPGTKAKDGKFDRWLKMDSPGVSPPYILGLFEVDAVGGYSMLETQFGIHIVRLDAIKESSYLPYEDVKDQLIKSLENEYKSLSAKAYNRSFHISDKATIDGKALDAMFKQYEKGGE